MPKCIACHSYATHKAKGHPMCELHALLMSNAKRIHPDTKVPHCQNCKQPLNVVDWNSTRFMFLCTTSGCILSYCPQGGELKHNAMPSRSVREEVSIH